MASHGGFIGNQRLQVQAPEEAQSPEQFGGEPEKDLSLRQRAGALLRRALEGLQEQGQSAFSMAGQQLGEVPGELRALPGEIVDFGNQVRGILGTLASERREFFEDGTEEFPAGEVLEEQGGVTGAIRRRRALEAEELGR